MLDGRRAQACCLAQLWLEDQGLVEPLGDQLRRLAELVDKYRPQAQQGGQRE
jgi:hypothetical protein